nr:MAG TPA: hypothetical protein [Bacteriophage sp.]
MKSLVTKRRTERQAVIFLQKILIKNIKRKEVVNYVQN